MKAAGRVTSHDVHYTRTFRDRFISSLSEPIESIVICSPFFGSLPKPFNDIIGFCNFLDARGAERIQIITGPPGGRDQSLPMEAAKILAAKGVDILIRSAPFLHAKLYMIRYTKGHFRCFVGSANFTVGGFDRNHEIVAEMEGVGEPTVCHRELERLQVGTGAMSFTAWIGHGLPKGTEEAR